ncbi:glycosyltransferase family 4 protein [Halorubrum ezzemoulense]|uniref:glycosyltransferase family 4 protein n=1 Tax=Halorubrum ezzemoulense TaxID=337243 RepID=UPI002330ED60|nr:glycosyltransferase family 4 protein [Halorubrum ezzemoulense]MDB2269884.1 glycosyltransferase family 4 protein [Halorubrum ezzemoulense]
MRILNLVTTPRSFFDNQLQTLRKLGIKVDVLQIPGRKSQNDSRSISNYVKYYPTVLQEQIKKYDIIHANYGNTAPFALFQPTRPIVITYWGSDLMGRFGTVNSKFANFFDEVILPSPILTEYVSCEHHVIPFGIDTDLFRPIKKSKARSKIGWDPNENYILFPYLKTRDVKNYSLAKRVAGQIDPNIKLVSLNDVEYELMPYYMNASDAVLITSKRESGPMVVKEATLCNVPVVSTDVGFVSDVLSNVDNSYVCNSEATLVKRLEYVVKSGSRSDGRKHANEWGLNNMGNQLIKIYETALGGQ